MIVAILPLITSDVDDQHLREEKHISAYAQQGKFDNVHKHGVKTKTIQSTWVMILLDCSLSQTNNGTYKRAESFSAIPCASISPLEIASIM